MCSAYIRDLNCWRCRTPSYSRGTVSFDMGSGSRRIKDGYRLTMRFPEDYPASPPVTYETGGAIPPHV